MVAQPLLAYLKTKEMILRLLTRKETRLAELMSRTLGIPNLFRDVVVDN